MRLHDCYSCIYDLAASPVLLSSSPPLLWAVRASLATSLPPSSPPPPHAEAVPLAPSPGPSCAAVLVLFQFSSTIVS